MEYPFTLCEYIFNKEAEWPIAEQNMVRQESRSRGMLGAGGSESGVDSQTQGRRWVHHAKKGTNTWQSVNKERANLKRKS